jgi:acyl-CoA reductase-like NAD-dependent aldehyde dehydrogenase
MLQIPNWINGQNQLPSNHQWLPKYNPHNGQILSYFADSQNADVQIALETASNKFIEWSSTTAVERGQILNEIAQMMNARAKEISECVAIETGKSFKNAEAEVRASILQAQFFSGEGMRFYGRSLTSAVKGKYSHTIRQALGVAGLIVPANTPIANIAWKVFPALICGNTVVLKASEDAPNTAHLFAEITKQAGLLDGVFNVVQGEGKIAGEALVEDPRAVIISFTGSTHVGKHIAKIAGQRLARVSLELGGKNAFIVCDDADLDQAVHWASLSAFSNAGQRCAAASRIIVFNSIYHEFLKRFLNRVEQLKLGVEDDCDLGPLINLRSQNNILEAIRQAQQENARIIMGGETPNEAELSSGYYVKPTVIEHLNIDSNLSHRELFGPLVAIYPANDVHEALKMANNTKYGLTAAIHTQNVDRAMWFAQHLRTGVVNVNLATFGSEPHMPFGGFGDSGNGTREPGVEALEVYSELKNISFMVRQNLL